MSDRVATLHAMIMLQVGGALQGMSQLGSAAKQLGPSLTAAFKNSADSVGFYDKQLEKVAKSIGRGDFSSSTIEQLKRLTEHYNQARLAHQVWNTPDRPRLEARIAAVSRLQGIANTMAMPPVREPQQQGPPREAFERQAAIDARDRAAWTQMVLAENRRQVSNNNFGGRVYHNRPAPALINPDLNRAMLLAQQQDAENDRPFDTGEMYGPPRRDWERERNIARNVDRRNTTSTLDAARREVYDRPTYGPSREDNARLQAQYAADEQRRRENRAATTASILESNRYTAPTSRGHWQAGESNGSFTPVTRVGGVRPSDVMSREDYSSRFGQRLGSMNEENLRRVQQQLTRMQMSGRDVAGQMQMVNAAIATIVPTSAAAANATGRIGAGAPGDPRGGGGLTGRSGKGSDIRAFRWQTQNLAFGIEDATVGYQTGGIKGAIRGATNNATAMMMGIKDPLLMGGAIAATSAIGALIPVVLDLSTKMEEGRNEVEAFTKSINKLSELDRESLKMDKLLNKDLRKDDEGRYDPSAHHGELEGSRVGAEDEVKEAEARVKRLAEARRGAAAEREKGGGDIFNLGGERERAHETRIVKSGLGGRHTRMGENVEQIDAWMGNAFKGMAKGMGFFADETKRREESLTALKNEEEATKMLAEAYIELEKAKEKRDKIKPSEDAAKALADKFKEAKKSADEFFKTIDHEEKMNDRPFSSEELKERSEKYLKTRENEVAFGSRWTGDLGERESLAARDRKEIEDGMKDRLPVADERVQEFNKQRAAKDAQDQKQAAAELKRNQEESQRLKEQMTEKIDPIEAIRMRYERQAKDLMDNPAISGQRMTPDERQQWETSTKDKLLASNEAERKQVRKDAYEKVKGDPDKENEFILRGQNKINAEYAQRAEAIKNRKLNPVGDIDDMLALNEQARDKEIERATHLGNKPINSGVQGGTREDAELRQRLTGVAGSKDDQANNQRQQMITAINKTNSHLADIKKRSSRKVKL